MLFFLHFLYLCYRLGPAMTATYEKEDIFGFEIPTSLPGVNPKVLNPKHSWADHAAYEETAKKLAQMYVDNFKKYEGKGSVDYTKFGPHV
jgi:phosphoenolpyruvate carboxykinase (ATP)